MDTCTCGVMLKTVERVRSSSSSENTHTEHRREMAMNENQKATQKRLGSCRRQNCSERSATSERSGEMGQSVCEV